MSSPAITVIITTRDRARLLADALRSIAAQRLRPLEVRIADDGEIRLRMDRVVPRGLEVVVIAAHAGQPAAARNRAVLGARGEVLAFLDDDDLWLPGHLEGLSAAFESPEVDFAYRDSAVIREAVVESGDRLDRRELERRVIARDWEIELMRRDDYLPPSSWGVRRAFFERLGGFDESFRYSEDWDLLLRAASLSTPRRVPGVTVEVRLRETGNLSAEAGTGRLECLRRLAARHRLAPLEIKTFWEVALTLGVRGRSS